MAMPGIMRQLWRLVFILVTIPGDGTPDGAVHFRCAEQGAYSRLQQTVPMMHAALAVREVTARGGRILFVGTKRQASEIVSKLQAVDSTMSIIVGLVDKQTENYAASIKRLHELGCLIPLSGGGLTKKELLNLTRERDKLIALGGIKDMAGLPDMLFVIDTNKEELAVAEAVKLGIPVVAVIDSNSSPNGITFPIPGNDDAIRSIALYCDLVAASVLDGLQQEAATSGVDIGEAEEAPAEDIPTTKAEPEQGVAIEDAVSEEVATDAAEQLTENKSVAE